ncbi:phage holin family protein [Bartonella sp. DGB2]|uniref:phage holin family protein n=1 Tax=Bartonella sp. DGB2 TaxID=3388426 RepID=UPI0039903711
MFKLFVPLLSGALRNQIQTKVQSLRNQSMAYGIAALAGLFALFFLSVMVFIALSHLSAPLWAAGGLSAFWLLIAIIGILFARVTSKKKQQEAKYIWQKQKNTLLMASSAGGLSHFLKKKLRTKNWQHKASIALITSASLAGLTFWLKRRNR